MCGIFGTIFRDPRRHADDARVTAARDSLTHRGPDEAGLWSIPGAALGHRRLKVLDLTHGQQPLVDAASRRALVYNGEVYNFRELRDHYSRRGAAFSTQCDTEVVFAALNDEGPAALNRFNGMFALGHWDDQDRALLLVRDRLGKKPLYWCADDSQLVFASELKAILVYLDRRFDVDPVALDRYFARGYIPAPRTIFTGISKLPAGCLLRADARPGHWHWHVEPWWDFTPRDVPADPQAALDELDELLTDAVRLRLVSDVPIGCLLSGGVDSSLITALAAKVSPEPVKAFSIGFDEASAHNELPYAQMVAQRHGCRWFNQSVRGDDFMAMLDETAPFLDEPYGNFTVFSMRRLACLARQQLVVVLSGQGGDELAAGYPGRYNWAAAPAPASGGASRYAPPVDDLVQHLNHSSFLPWAAGCEAIFSPALRSDILARATPADDVLPFWNRHPGLDRLNNVLYVDARTNLPDYLITLEERMSMSASLEARNPLLDHRVVDFMLSLPAALKVRDGKNKWVLTELARRYVPAAAIDRPKRGFTPPLDLWLTGNAPALVEEFRATQGQTAGIYAPLWQEFLRRGQFGDNMVMPVYYSLMLAQWVKHYGRYIGAWPGDTAPKPTDAMYSSLPWGSSAPREVMHGPQSAIGNWKWAIPPASWPPGTDLSPWQNALRTQSPAALAEARWFCQAMSNFAPATSVVIHGDAAAWFAFLARGCGMAVAAPGDTAATPAQGHVHIGLAALAALAKPGGPVGGGPEPGVNAAPHITTLIFATFATSRSDEVKRLLQQLADAGSLPRYQAVALSSDRAVLIARCLPLSLGGFAQQL